MMSVCVLSWRNCPSCSFLNFIPTLLLFLRLRTQNQPTLECSELAQGRPVRGILGNVCEDGRLRESQPTKTISWIQKNKNKWMIDTSSFCGVCCLSPSSSSDLEEPYYLLLILLLTWWWRRFKPRLVSFGRDLWPLPSGRRQRALLRHSPDAVSERLQHARRLLHGGVRLPVAPEGHRVLLWVFSGLIHHVRHIIPLNDVRLRRNDRR